MIVPAATEEMRNTAMKNESYEEYLRRYVKDAARYNEKTAPFVDYMVDHFEEICEAIDQAFEERKTEIVEKLSGLLSAELGDGNLTHFEWYKDDCYWDDSGDVREDGVVDLNQTVEEFLHELTGTWAATFESHHGKSYDRYSDSFSYDTLDLGEEIMSDTILQYLAAAFPGKEWDDKNTLDGIRDVMHDPFYDNTRTYEFFDAEGAFNFAGLMDKPLSDFVAEQKEVGHGVLQLVVDNTKPSGN